METASKVLLAEYDMVEECERTEAKVRSFNSGGYMGEENDRAATYHCRCYPSMRSSHLQPTKSKM